MARYRPGGQNRVRRRFKSASSRRRINLPGNTPAEQNSLMPGEPTRMNASSRKVITEMFPMGHTIADCGNLPGGGQSLHYATCVGMADDFQGMWI
tara:strand:+ start:93 stop:377 length:285 start_codon:yes stop_codon:yes gene_type:complete